MFVALDVETANRHPSSICQIGIVTFEDDRIVREWQTLVNPCAPFDRGNIRVHGITPAAVRDAPTFADLADEIEARIAGHITVAHNSRFDHGCLRAALSASGRAEPVTDWLCTVRVARRAWADELERFGLKAVAGHLGLEFRHHDALEDARTCGRILIAACERKGLTAEEWLARVERPVRERRRDVDVTNYAPAQSGGPGSISGRALAHLHARPRYRR